MTGKKHRMSGLPLNYKIKYLKPVKRGLSVGAL